MTKLLLLLTLLPFGVFASGGDSSQSLDLTDHWVGYTALILFVIAYIFVMVEEFTHFRKSKPVILVAGLIWGLIGFKINLVRIMRGKGMPISHKEIRIIFVL